MLGFIKFRDNILREVRGIIGDMYEIEGYIRSAYSLYTSLGWTVEDAASWIIANVTNNEHLNLELHSEGLFMYLVNRQTMGDLLAEVPHIVFGEFAAYPRLMVGDEGDLEASIPVTYDLISNQNISRTRVCKLAMRNTQAMTYICETAETKIHRMLRRKYGNFEGMKIANMVCPRDEEGSMYILTNERSIGGAVCLMFEKVLEDAAKLMGVTKFYILPSSEHELILIPGTKYGTAKLESVIREVNEGIGVGENPLSNSVYEFDLRSSRVTKIA